MFYRKKPVVIDAMHFSSSDDVEQIRRWSGGMIVPHEGDPVSSNPSFLVVKTLEGTMQARPGDWLIRGVKGEYYPCKPDIFDATYEPVP